MPKHAVLRNVKHNGKNVAPGGSIDISPEDAAPLIKTGHLEAPKDSQKKAE